MVQVKVRHGVLHRVAAERTLTIAELAQLVDIPVSHLYALLRQEYQPSVRTRRKLMARLGLPFEALFEITEEREAVRT